MSGLELSELSMRSPESALEESCVIFFDFLDSKAGGWAGGCCTEFTAESIIRLERVQQLRDEESTAVKEMIDVGLNYL